MSSNIDARISTAHLELSKAQSQLSKKDIDKLLNDFGNELTISSNGLGLMAEKLSSSNKKIGKAGGIVLFVGTTIGNIYIDSSIGESGWKQFWGIVGDGATAMAMAFIPGIGWTTLALKYSASTALSMLNLDASSGFKALYDYITGNKANDNSAKITIENGFLRITMPDGTVYARPFALDAKGLITGDSKDDVLFGGSGNDILQGGLGSDILLGGNGYDTYNADNGDFIRDIDGRGRIYLGGGKLTGGKWNEKKQAYIGKDGATYKLDNNSNILTVSKNGHQITVDMFDKDKKTLDIVLQDAKEVLVSVSDVTAGEKDEKMEFKISLDRKLEKEETLTLKINDEEIVFKENDQEKTYTYTWKDNQTKNEDINFEINPQIVTDKSNVKAKIEKPGLGKIIDDDRDPKDDLPETYDPIVIDFNKNGITSTRLDNTVYFDHDNNGFKEATAWIEKDDGLLVLDKNGNGKIDNGNELFGNHTVSNTIYGYTDKKATNGYEALKAYDLNNDNVIDEKDEIFNKLKIWKDKNSNGITDEGELSSLAHNNIKSIDLNYKEIAMDENSNTVKQSSKVTLKDGSTLDANDVWFKVNLDKTKEEDINIPLEIRSLPKVKAFGNLNSLQVAASGNEKLATMINLYLMLNPEDRKKHINDIVYEWAGVNDMDPNSRTTSIDSRMVNVYEKITGKPFTWRGNFNDANIRISANIIKERFDVFKHYVYATIELQTTYADIDLDTETMSLENNVKPSYKFDALNSKLTQLYKDNRHDEIKNLMDIVREAGAYKPVFQETLKTNLISLCSSDNKFLSLCLNTYIQGTDSNEVLNGSFENNFIVGGKGNDILHGRGGNDIYAFAKGDGKDTIYDTAGNDKIDFKEGIAPGDVSFKRELDKLIISIKSGSEADGDSITVQNFFSVNPAIGNNTVRTITFTDGTVYDFNKILELTPLNSTDKNDKLYLTDDNDTFDAGPGNDEIWGGNGDDTLSGGKGDDILYGNDGNDTYVFNKGDGHDIIEDYKGNDIIKFNDFNLGDIDIKRVFNDVVISSKISNDTIIIKDTPNQNHATMHTIKKIVFKDGSAVRYQAIFDDSHIKATEGNDKFYLGNNDNEFNALGGDDEIYGQDGDDIINGGEGNDKLYGEDGNDIIDGGEGDDLIEGGSGDDTLMGGAGNDTLSGGKGDDIYIYNKGDGNDTIVDMGGADVIKFGQGINKEDLIATLKDNANHKNDIIFTFKNSPNDSIVIKEVLASKNINASKKIETLEFANGEKIKLEDMALHITDNDYNISGYEDLKNIIKGNSKNNVLQGGALNDTIYGGDGDDYINGYDGDDILYGGNGKDRFYGGNGNDMLIGGEGNDDLWGENGNDTIEGGSGNDTIYGGEGEDTYIFGRGDGQDIVYADGNDTIKFKAGLTQNDLIFRRSESSKDGFNNGLILKIKDSHDSIVIKDAFKDENNSRGIKGVEFDNGSFMSFEEIKRKVLVSSDQEQTVFEGFNSDDTIIGGDGNDYLSGKGGNDTLIGNNGDDRIYGGDGDDIITGGKGDDELSGDNGSDTYVFGRGDGKDSITNYDDNPNKTDVIKFKEGIVREDLILQKLRTFKYGSDFLIKIKGSDDSILVKNMFDIENNNYVLNEKSKIDKIEFSDGSFMDIEDIKQALKNNNVIIHKNNSFWKDSEGSDESDEIYGNDDDNSLKGNKGDDILVGGKGSDSLYGGEGNDTYVFGRGDGEDTIYNYDPTPNRRDIIKFKEGITKNDLIFKRSLNYNNQNDSLIIEIKGTSDSVTVSGMFYNENTTDRIDGIEFSDGTFMDFNDIKQKVLTSPDSNDNNIYGFSSDDVLIGGNGNDYLNGYGGNDTMKGGLGNDTYTYDYRSGHVIIEDIGGEDTLYINVPKTGLEFKKDGNDLFISSSDNHSQSIRVKNHFLSDNYSIDKISFNPYGEYFLTKDDINKLANAVYLSSANGNNNLSDKDKKDNVYTYTGGKVTISDNGGDDRVVFRLDDDNDQESRVYYSSNGRDLKISTAKIDSSNKNVLEIKNFFVNRNSIIENFDINDYWSITAQSIYEKFGKAFPPETPDTPDDPTPSNPGDGDNGSLTGGSEDNVFNYKGGMVSITDTGGNDKVIFKNPGSRVFYSSNGRDLKISTSKINSSNKNVLEVKNFFSDKNYIIEEFQISDYWTVTAESIYQAFGKTYPAAQNAPLALLGVPNKTNEDSLNDNASDM